MLYSLHTARQLLRPNCYLFRSQHMCPIECNHLIPEEYPILCMRPLGRKERDLDVLLSRNQQFQDMFEEVLKRVSVIAEAMAYWQIVVDLVWTSSKAATHSFIGADDVDGLACRTVMTRW